MGRRAKDEAEKRKLIGARFDPEVRQFLETQAETNSRSAGAEVEARVAATMGLDKEGLELVAAIAREIVAIHQIAKGARWHKDLRPWAAVKEMLHRGPIERFRPDPWEDDELVQKAYQKYHALSERRLEIVDFFKTLGLTIDPEPKTKALGLLGRALNTDGGRTQARDVLEGAEPSPGIEDALSRLDQLLELDVQIEAAHEHWKELLMPYLDRGIEGIRLYRDRLQAEARRQLAEGDKTYSATDLWGIWQ